MDLQSLPAPRLTLTRTRSAISQSKSTVAPDEPEGATMTKIDHEIRTAIEQVNQ
jgi:hypothetical protein